MIGMLQQPLGALLGAHFGESSWGQICVDNIMGCMNSFEAKKPSTNNLYYVMSPLTVGKMKRGGYPTMLGVVTLIFLVSAGCI